MALSPHYSLWNTTTKEAAIITITFQADLIMP